MQSVKPLTPAFEQLKRVLSRVDALTYWIIAGAIGGMTLIVAIQVVMRYFFGLSIDSADELSRLLFVWAIFLAIPHGVKAGVHVGIDILISRFRDHTREIIFRITGVLSLVLMVMLIYGAAVATMERWPELMPTLPISSAVFYIPLLICAIHSSLHLVLQIRGGPLVWQETAQ